MPRWLTSHFMHVQSSNSSATGLKAALFIGIVLKTSSRFWKDEGVFESTSMPPLTLTCIPSLQICRISFIMGPMHHPGNRAWSALADATALLDDIKVCLNTRKGMKGFHSYFNVHSIHLAANE